MLWAFMVNFSLVYDLIVPVLVAYASNLVHNMMIEGNCWFRHGYTVTCV